MTSVVAFGMYQINQWLNDFYFNFSSDLCLWSEFIVVALLIFRYIYALIGGTVAPIINHSIVFVMAFVAVVAVVILHTQIHSFKFEKNRLLNKNGSYKKTIRERKKKQMDCGR